MGGPKVGKEMDREARRKEMLKWEWERETGWDRGGCEGEN